MALISNEIRSKFNVEVSLIYSPSVVMPTGVEYCFASKIEKYSTTIHKYKHFK